MVARIIRWLSWPSINRQSELRHLYDAAPAGMPIRIRSLAEAEFLHEYARSKNPLLNRFETEHTYVKSGENHAEVS